MVMHASITDIKCPAPAASYKLTANLENHRGVYSFCMCPGGYVVNASSEEGMLAVNGWAIMQEPAECQQCHYHIGSTGWFWRDGPLAGIEFQRKLEKNAYRIGNGAIPQQLTVILKRIAYLQDMGLLKVPQRVHIHLQISGKFFQKN